MAEGGNVQPSMDRDEHNEAARAKRALMRGFDGADYNNAKINSDGSLDVNLAGATGVTVDITGDHEDLDSGGGTDDHEVFAIGLPGAGGHVVGGTDTNPLRTSPSSTAADQPVTQAAHDSLNANANLQVGDADVSTSNPVPINGTSLVDDAAGGTDRGMVLLAKHQEDQVHLTTADGDYDHVTMDSLGSVHVNAEAHHIWDNLEDTSGWTVIDDDTDTLATSTNHIIGEFALSFNKANGTANTGIAGIQKTRTTVDLGDISPHDIMQAIFYAPDTTVMDYVFCRLGTDSSNYNEWHIDATELTSGSWENLAFIIGDADFDSTAGVGWDHTAVTYIALGCQFTNVNDTQTGIHFDQFSYHTNQHTTTSLNAEVSSSVSSPNVKINGYGGSTATNTGNANANTLRTVLATDQPDLQVNLQDGGGTDLTSTLVSGDQALDVNVVQTVTTGGETEYTDDGDWTALTSKHTLIGGIYQSTPGSITDGDTGPLRVDVNGHVINSPHATSTALPDNVSNTQSVISDESGNLLINAAFGYMFDGSTWDRVRGNSTDGMQVDLGANNDIQGDVAHDTADANNPMKIGAKAFADGTPQSDVGANDRVNLMADLAGMLWTREKPRIHEINLTALEDTYDNVTTENSSADIDFSEFRSGTLMVDVTVANTPTSIQFFLQEKASDGQYYNVRRGPWGRMIFDDTIWSSQANIALKITEDECPVNEGRIRVTTAGTTASATFTINDCYISLKN